jgi:hypothetical protein
MVAMTCGFNRKTDAVQQVQPEAGNQINQGDGRDPQCYECAAGNSNVNAQRQITRSLFLA